MSVFGVSGFLPYVDSLPGQLQEKNHDGCVSRGFGYVLMTLAVLDMAGIAWGANYGIRCHWHCSSGSDDTV